MANRHAQGRPPQPNCPRCGQPKARNADGTLRSYCDEHNRETARAYQAKLRKVARDARQSTGQTRQVGMVIVDPQTGKFQYAAVVISREFSAEGEDGQRAIEAARRRGLLVAYRDAGE